VQVGNYADRIYDFFDTMIDEAGYEVTLLFRGASHIIVKIGSDCLSETSYLADNCLS
jgi:hypothetical protein